MDKLDFALESFKNHQDLIKFMDQKSGVVLVVCGLILSAFIEFSKNLVFVHASLSLTQVVVFLLGLSTISLLGFTIYIAVDVLRPRLAQGYVSGDLSLFYFKHLASVDKNRIYNEFLSANRTHSLKILTDQVYELSRILDKKMTAVHNSMNFLLWCIGSLLLFIMFSRFL
jgi:hypothetical protein